ncbi:MAG: flagellar basal body P-ring formation chaperone FlgA [Candidatus Margulisiibacteriota bacterium]
MRKLIAVWVAAGLFYFGMSAFFPVPVFSASSLEIEKQIKAVVWSAVVEKYPEYKNDEIKISFSLADNIFSALADETKEFTFKVLELYPRGQLLGKVTVPVQVFQNGRPDTKIYLKTQVEIYRPVVVASRMLKKQTVIEDADLVLRRVDLVRIAKDFFTQKDELLGCETKTIIRSGMPLLSWMVRPVPLVYRGDIVKIKVVRGLVQVEVMGKALSDGKLGTKIKVRRADNKQEIAAVVVGTAEVEIN